MVVPFGFSFGDMVSGISLVKDLIKALQDSGGAATDYRNLMSELYGLERALIAIKDLSLLESADEYQAVRQAVGQCQICVDRFLQKVIKYQPLSAATTALRDAVKKVTWALCRQEDLLKFRRSLEMQKSSMILLLNALQISRSASQDTRMNDSLLQQSVVLREMQIDVHDGALEQINLLKQIEGLLRSAQIGKPTSADHYVVRPLRLIGAPISPGFVSRPVVMGSIERILLPPDCDRQKILVLQGLGGIGKSQIAREFATVHQHDYTSIFWVNATSEQSLRNSMSAIAERVPLSKVLNAEGRVGRGMGEIAMAITVVIEWFNEHENDQWLLIFDNADNQNQGLENDSGNQALTDAYDIFQYLPSSSHGTVLITSRLASLGRHLGGTTLNIEGMTVEESLQLLARASSRPVNEAGATEIVHNLGFYPVALSQAGRYIFENQINCRKYLEKYEKRIAALLEQRPNIREYERGSIATTLTLSYDMLKAKKPTAAAFLSMCAYFDNADVSWAIVGTSYQKSEPGWEIWGAIVSPFCEWIPGLPKDWLDSVRCDEEGFDEVVRALHEQSFIRRNEALDSVTIHPLVHQWLISRNDARSKSRFLAVVAKIIAVNLGSYNKLSNTRLTSHADHCLALTEDGLQLVNWSTESLFYLAALYHDQSQPTKARLFIRELLYRLRATYDVWDEITLKRLLHTMTINIYNDTIVAHLGRLHVIQEAIWSLPVSRRKTRILDADFRMQLVFAYLVQEDFATALEKCLETVKNLKNIPLDVRFNSCLTALLAECFLQTGDLQRSLHMTQRALELFHRTYGLDDPEDSGIMDQSLRIHTVRAIALTRAGQYEQGDFLFAQTLAGYQLTRGPEHPLTKLAAENQNLARLRKSEGLKTDVHIPYMRWHLAMGMFQPRMLSTVVEMEDPGLKNQDDSKDDIELASMPGTASLNRPSGLPLRYR